MDNFRALLSFQDEDDPGGGYFFILKNKYLYDFILQVDHMAGTCTIPLNTGQLVVILEEGNNRDAKAIAVSEITDESIVEIIRELDGEDIVEYYNNLFILYLDDELTFSSIADYTFDELTSRLFEAYNIDESNNIHVNLDY